ncbi:hypothetical protein ABXT08_12260 [Chryseobacterium sp. NRRL B-14859]|uniref:MutS-related protein n=1 Tax=Chryseobacterium sp. NRRL B-14859 TaxID=1562763 RepID=UPI0033966215
MRPHLLYPDNDFNRDADLVWNAETLIKDLELQVLFKAMSNENEIISNIIPKVLLNEKSNDQSIILYRQQILKDCLANREVITLLFDLSLQAIESKKSSWYGVFINHPTSLLHSSVALLEISMDYLNQFRDLAVLHIQKFKSEGMVKFFQLLIEKLPDEYLKNVEENLKSLKLYGRIHSSVRLGYANKGTDYVLQKNTPKKRSWWNWLFPEKIEGYYFEINPRDISACNALSRINDQTVNETANLLAQANDQITIFFSLIRDELAFYLGCIQLSDKLQELKMPAAFPEPLPESSDMFNVENLYDPCLALTSGHSVIGNDIEGKGKDIFIITGANRGGKSTFLRSVGIAHLMMQSGMFVGASRFSANTVRQVFTHFKKEEDKTMSSGKFDEELYRMNDIVCHLRKGSLVLFNESFAATNEREGSEVATQIITALQLNEIKVFYVTHLYDFVLGLYQKQLPNTEFLQAVRQQEGGKTGKLSVGYPLPTSFAEDLYHKIFN